MITFNKRQWLNSNSSPSLGYVAAYHGDSPFYDGVETSLAIADCHSIVKLHQTKLDTPQDFINKLHLLKDFVNEYIYFLEQHT